MSDKILIAPSILSADFAEMGSAVRKIDEAGADFIHMDVMDGIFVPNITFGIKMVADIRPVTERTLDVHLMIDRPERYIKEFAKAGADIITVHYEACEKPVTEVLDDIRALGVKSAVSIKPDTPVEVLKELISHSDMILIMSVYPGFGGQKFIENSVSRIAETKKYIDESGKNVLLEVDGGITAENVRRVKEAGANVIVAGSSVFKAGDIKKAIRDLRQL